MNRIDVVLTGNLELGDDGKIISESTYSTCTLVRGGDHVILVDTGRDNVRDELLSGLESVGISAEDVTDVVLTHSHGDHIGNYRIFEGARVLLRKEGRLPGTVPVEKDMDIAPGIRLVHTPGHTKDSMSVLVEGGRKVAIAGDTIPLESNARKLVPPNLHYDRDLAFNSLQNLIFWADSVVPGHGPIFDLV